MQTHYKPNTTKSEVSCSSQFGTIVSLQTPICNSYHLSSNDKNSTSQKASASKKSK
ncbi:MAG: hypothetical protein FWG20_01130 [Candidatus Cloacimonetes bacterium]|nr:hypothetical protein [Candidatus Cloacimonadota bacterium]